MYIFFLHPSAGNGQMHRDFWSHENRCGIFGKLCVDSRSFLVIFKVYFFCWSQEPPFVYFCIEIGYDYKIFLQKINR